jgi:hypothetical protein
MFRWHLKKAICCGRMALIKWDGRITKLEGGTGPAVAPVDSRR